MQVFSTFEWEVYPFYVLFRASNSAATARTVFSADVT